MIKHHKLPNSNKMWFTLVFLIILIYGVCLVNCTFSTLFQLKQAICLQGSIGLVNIVERQTSYSVLESDWIESALCVLEILCDIFNPKFS